MTRISRAIAVLFGAMILAGCGRLDQLRLQPPTTPEQWCAELPCVKVGNTVFNEPFGTFLIFLLAVLLIAAGAYFLVTRHAERSRTWLGITLLIAGVGSISAGISFQAFSYELKCAGLEYCRLTNGFEVGFSVAQALSVSSMLIVVAFACTRSGLRRGLIIYSVLNAVVYCIVTIAAVMIPSALLLSFSVLMFFSVPGLIAVVIVAGSRYRRSRAAVDRRLMITGIFILTVQTVFFIYGMLGITAKLWDGGQGIFFSDNDVLHTGMIAWTCYVFFALRHTLRDRSSEADVEAAEDFSQRS